jgi:hypothetical protein
LRTFKLESKQKAFEPKRYALSLPQSNPLFNGSAGQISVSIKDVWVYPNLDKPEPKSFLILLPK